MACAGKVKSAACRLGPVAILVLALAVPAAAAPITRTYDVTVNNVHDLTGNNVAAPFNPVVGSFTVTFDPALLTIVNQTSGITVNSLNLTVASPIAFSYSAANTDEVQIGGLDQGTGGLTDGLSDFLVDIFDASGQQPFFGNMTYTISATTVATGQFSDFGPSSRADGTVTVVPGLAVPEPPMSVLFLAGGLLSVAVKRRGKSRNA
ncbi:MAG TPA: PEP-CTERM sorting domain-containing protein [Acetobacteraceae bacterium]